MGLEVETNLMDERGRTLADGGGDKSPELDVAGGSRESGTLGSKVSSRSI